MTRRCNRVDGGLIAILLVSMKRFRSSGILVRSGISHGWASWLHMKLNIVARLALSRSLYYRVSLQTTFLYNSIHLFAPYLICANTTRVNRTRHRNHTHRYCRIFYYQIHGYRLSANREQCSVDTFSSTVYKHHKTQSNRPING